MWQQYSMILGNYMDSLKSVGAKGDEESSWRQELRVKDIKSFSKCNESEVADAYT